jgi:putative ABC transport system permease protein
MVSEAFARQHTKQVGDHFKLATPDGEKTIIVAAVYEDFTTDRGLIFMDSKIYQALWRDTEANSLALYFTSEIDSLSLQQNLSRELASSGQYLVYSNKKIRDEAMRIFDQTFAVTHLLRFISLLVAGIGIFLSISILTSERQREIAVLRAIGGSRSQVVKIILWESALLGSVSAILGTIGGFVLAVILTYVINVSFFGWTIEWATPWLTVLLTPFFVVLTALLSAFYPAWKAAHKEIANAVREE